jgi:hypothetical protein
MILIISELSVEAEMDFNATKFTEIFPNHAQMPQGLTQPRIKMSGKVCIDSLK